MKQMSIKLRVTLWYTLWMMLLVMLVLVFLFSVGESVVLTGSRNDVLRVVQGSVDELDADEGRLEIDDDLQAFADGVYLSIYDAQGRLLFGQMPSGFDATTMLTTGDVRTVAGENGNFLVYDLQYTVRSYGEIWIRGVSSADSADQTFDTMYTLALIALPFLVVLVALGGYAITKRAFAPVRRITQTAEHIADSGDLHARIELGAGKDEIYTLANAFDRMFDRLQQAFEKEKQFTSDASHELRTPVSVIISQCEDALDSAQTLPQARAALDTVLQQAQKMSALIAQLLTLARADRGQYHLQLERVDLSEMMEMVAAEQQQYAAHKHIDIVLDIQPGLTLSGDETMLMRMLINLVENGIRYGREGGHLWLRLHAQAETIVGEVQDDGIGIADTHLNRIWDRFYQVDPSRSASRAGAGLGLSMVQWIVHAHGGTIAVQSALGQGSTFTFVLPMG